MKAFAVLSPASFSSGWKKLFIELELGTDLASIIRVTN
jgi:hypothetical protein